MDIRPAEPRHGAALDTLQEWDGSTYYGRQQLKPWPFEAPVVGGYIFLAGVSGSAAILAAIASATGDGDLRGVVRRGRYLSLLAPTIGAGLLIYDLHTPKRFYNMLRVAKATSPMSIGTWILMGFSAAAFTAAAAQAGTDLRPQRQRWLSVVGKLAGVPAAVAGAGLSTYTAALLAATSTPVWAAAPATLAVRFGSSSVATGAAALALGERDAAVRARLDAVQASALVLEALAAASMKARYRQVGVEGAFEGAAGLSETVGATVVGMVVPLGLLAASALLRHRPRALSVVAALATLTGSATLRISMLELGTVSARRPDVSFRFSTPRNLSNYVR